MAVHLQGFGYEANEALCGETDVQTRYHPGRFGVVPPEVTCHHCRGLYEFEKHLYQELESGTVGAFQSNFNSPVPPPPVDPPTYTHIVPDDYAGGTHALCGYPNPEGTVSRSSARVGDFFDCPGCRAVLTLESRIDPGGSHSDAINPRVLDGKENPWLTDDEPSEGDDGQSALARRVTLLERHVSALSVAMGVVWLNTHKLAGQEVGEKFYEELEKMATQGELCVPSFDGATFSYSVTGRSKPRQRKSLWSLLSGLPDPDEGGPAPSEPKKGNGAQEGA